VSRRAGAALGELLVVGLLAVAVGVHVAARERRVVAVRQPPFVDERLRVLAVDHDPDRDERLVERLGHPLDRFGSRVIRTGARIAGRLGSHWYAV
jgi:hypothetical protein